MNTETNLNFFSSNRTEILFEALKNSLFCIPSSPFKRRLIIVPSAAMKFWLKAQLAKDLDCRIAAGLEICYIDQALTKLCRLSHLNSSFFDRERTFFPNEIQLSFFFESLIFRKIQDFSVMQNELQEIWQPLLGYLKALPVINARKTEKRLIALCDGLTTLFFQYGRYGCQMIDRWERGENPKCWQAELWREAKKKFPDLKFPCQEIALAMQEIDNFSGCLLQNVEIHIFSVSFLHDQAYHFLMAISKHLPVNYYLLSPCQLFWSDICSDRERLKAHALWKKKQAPISQQFALDEFLQDRNTLLANFGKIGRKMAMQVEESAGNFSDYYVLPKAVYGMAQYEEMISEEIHFDSSLTPLTLLQAVQADMVLLRNLDSEEKIDFPKTDCSIQIHVAPTSYREIEILYNTILEITTKHSNDLDPITLGDIIVMAPDLTPYEPAISSIFGSLTSLVDFQITDVKTAASSLFVRGFLHLLSLADSRWEADLFLELLEYPAFARKMAISGEDILQLREWAHTSGALWGQTVEHRNEKLHEAHESGRAIDQNPVGTWDHSLDRLLMATLVEPGEWKGVLNDFAAPAKGIDSSQIDLLEKWIVLINSLKEDLRCLADRSVMELKDWSLYLQCLKNTYFAADSNDKDEMAYDALLDGYLQEIAFAGKFVEKELFSFYNVKTKLERLLSQGNAQFKETDMHSVRFCSLLHMHAIPAKVIILIGMQEGVFPRRADSFSLNEMIGEKDVDYCPTSTDLDRYFFLETLLSARNYLVLSYVGYCFESNKETLPSLVLQELFSYLDSGCTVDGKDASLHCIRKHPFDSFNKRYFQSDGGLSCYDKKHYHMALAYYGASKKCSHRFIPAFSFPAENQITSLEDEIVITIKELSAFASNPIQAYFNRTLQIYLDDRKKQQTTNEEPFQLDPLEKYQLRMQAIKTPFKDVIDQANKMGKLPQGLLKTVATENLFRDVEEMHENFFKIGLDPQKITPLFFSERCDEVSLSGDGVWVLPSLKCQDQYGRKIHIVGSLKEVSAQGLLFHQDCEFKHLLKIWPQYLIFRHAIELYSLPIAPQIISSKHPKPVVFSLESIDSFLASYIDYYFLGMQAPSPLIPDWTADLLKSDPSHFSKTVHKSLEDEHSAFYNDYALWLFRDKKSFPDCEMIHQNWHQIAVGLFSNLQKELGKK